MTTVPAQPTDVASVAADPREGRFYPARPLLGQSNPPVCRAVSAFAATLPPG